MKKGYITGETPYIRPSKYIELTVGYKQKRCQEKEK